MRVRMCEQIGAVIPFYHHCCFCFSSIDVLVEIILLDFIHILLYFTLSLLTSCIFTRDFFLQRVLYSAARPFYRFEKPNQHFDSVYLFVSFSNVIYCPVDFVPIIVFLATVKCFTSHNLEHIRLYLVIELACYCKYNNYKGNCTIIRFQMV